MSMKKTRDILFLCQYFYPEYISSATLPLQTAQALVSAGFSVSALCGYPREYRRMDDSDIPFEETYEGIEIKRLRYLQLDRASKMGRLINQFSFTASALSRLAYLRRFRAVIVYSNPPILPLVAVLASLLFGTTVVFVSYDVYPEIAEAMGYVAPRSVISLVMSFINKLVFRKSRKVIALSNEMKELLTRTRDPRESDQIEVIPNWYPDEFSKVSSSLISNPVLQNIRERNKLVVSYFGNMGICQDLDTIVKAIGELRNQKDIHFLFAGHGSKMEDLKAAIEKGVLDNVTVLGFLHGYDFWEALSISDCFIVSLEKNVTGLAVPSKTYTYMMAGKPVIAIMEESTDIAQDLLAHKAGFVVEHGNSGKLAMVLQGLRDSDLQRQSMGQNCRRLYMEQYTTEKCTQKYVELFREILEA